MIWNFGTFNKLNKDGLCLSVPKSDSEGGVSLEKSEYMLKLFAMKAVTKLKC